eukprot:09395.XXX_361247_360693_1 [CDS] Oithona nana genome sequencing.
MDKIADNVKGEEMTSSTRTDFHILFVPHKSLLCEMRLKDRGVFGSFSHLHELSIGFFPLDVDVISMERPSLELNRPHFDTMIILDRQVDMITPLLTQLTYEGLIDELFGIRNSVVKLPADKFSSEA